LTNASSEKSIRSARTQARRDLDAVAIFLNQPGKRQGDAPGMKFDQN